MKPLAFLPALACLLVTSFADDQTRDVQAALKAQGFYYGEVTGTENAETGAAIRRFQIRSGITVTGKLNAGTLDALGLGGKKSAATAPAKTAPPALANPPLAAAQTPAMKQVNPAAPAFTAPASKKPRAAAADANAQDTPPTISRPRSVTDPAVVNPPLPVPPAVSSPFTTMFRGTPYATAPREVQMATVRRAQAIMSARRFYRGPLDGIAGPATSEAVFLFQAEADLRRTGRLDLDTLAEMDLLPRAPRGNPLLKPFYNPNRHRDSSVDLDYLIR
ncbi:MAG: peptidoglycan-binding domain-containing protein [Chthoniobacteraceae bacterium]